MVPQNFFMNTSNSRFSVALDKVLQSIKPSDRSCSYPNKMERLFEASKNKATKLLHRHKFHCKMQGYFPQCE